MKLTHCSSLAFSPTRLSWLGALFLFACSSPQQDQGAGALESPPIWEVAYAATPPEIDGKIDAVWDQARPLTVTVRKAMGGGAPKRVVLRALHHAQRVYFLARWPDATRSDMRDPYVWDAASKQYNRPTEPDDQFALQFPISGDFQINMLTTSSFVADVWHWKAGRGNPAGWIDDKRHLIGDSAGENALVYEMGGHETVRIERPMDAGQRSYSVREKPTSYVGDIVDSYVPKQPTGSLADIQCKARHDGSGWTLEFSRKLNTGHGDDAVIDPAADTVCAIAVLDNELYWRHSVSGRLLLRFAPR